MMDWSSLNIPSNLFKVNLQDSTISDADTDEEDNIEDLTNDENNEYSFKQNIKHNSSLNGEELFLDQQRALVLFKS